VIEVLDRARTRIVEGKIGGSPTSSRNGAQDNWFTAVWQRWVAQRRWTPMWW
jgi:hypothetical protein